MGHKKILIVDDERDFLSMLKEALEPRGFDVIATSNAVEAGLYLAGRKPDVILMDIKMAGIDGFQACEAIKRNTETKDIPLIIVTALSDEEDITRARQLGVLDYFVKPIDIAKLVARLKMILKMA